MIVLKIFKFGIKNKKIQIHESHSAWKWMISSIEWKKNAENFIIQCYNVKNDQTYNQLNKMSSKNIFISLKVMWFLRANIWYSVQKRIEYFSITNYLYAFGRWFDLRGYKFLMLDQAWDPCTSSSSPSSAEVVLYRQFPTIMWTKHIFEWVCCMKEKREETLNFFEKWTHVFTEQISMNTKSWICRCNELYNFFNSPFIS